MTYRPARYSRRGSYEGMMFAIILSGPAFLCFLMIAMVIGPYAVPVSPRLVNELPMVAALLAVSMIVGSVLAILPLLIGTTIMIWLGRWSIGMRVVPVWALAGGVMAGGAGFAMDLGQEASLALAMTGALAAAVARTTAYWSDD